MIYRYNILNPRQLPSCLYNGRLESRKSKMVYRFHNDHDSIITVISCRVLIHSLKPPHNSHLSIIINDQKLTSEGGHFTGI